MRLPRPLLFAAISCVFLTPGTGFAAQCPAPAFQSQHKRQIPARNPDQAAFAEAVKEMVNLMRCQNNLARVKGGPRHVKAALLHSASMAKTRNFSHEADRGLRSVKDRAKKARVKWRFLAENIALISRYQFGHRKPFSVIDRKNCRFADPASGTEIAAHSYASLASNVVISWMNSPGHRKNILHPRAAVTGAALVFEGSGDSCGQYYITQVFSD